MQCGESEWATAKAWLIHRAEDSDDRDLFLATVSLLEHVGWSIPIPDHAVDITTAELTRCLV